MTPLQQRTEDVCALLVKAARAQAAAQPSVMLYEEAKAALDAMLVDHPEADHMRHVWGSVGYTAPEVMSIRTGQLREIAARLARRTHAA